ncbi:hypothetical protein [Helicobacter sp.]|uniref:hypothetical protein n=1 Tax=Helicobacter sp. TaxID=218 RepID=UPI002A74F87A|nr:hypothetical protein [Helicobacter sp.]MDY2585312.1 hypothetical protein [Helicobacter sp.]
MECLMCQGSLKEVCVSQKPLSVSSDNFLLKLGISLYACVECGHLQKFPKKEVLNQIYANYKTDSLLPNQEQVKFDSDVPKSNSYRLLENSLEFIPKRESLTMLDYGAGGGVCYRAF